MATQFSERHGVARRRVLAVVGARPNFVKVAPLLHALADLGDIDIEVLHTGQHYDRALSDSFIERLDMPAPDHCLGVGSGTHAEQTAAVLVGVERVLLAGRYHALVVPGDVNSTVGAALAASKLGVPVVHLESGLRSGDRSMPEEINRIVTDALSRYLFITEESAADNLRREGHPDSAIFFVGNVMVDSLLWCRNLAKSSTIIERLRLPKKGDGDGFALVTLHRPSNVDTPATLERVLSALAAIAQRLPVVLPAHPRTRGRVQEFGLDRFFEPLDTVSGPQASGRITLLEPAGYVDFFRLMSEARLVLTDSGGIQEETTCLGIPCLTLRDNTERPVTITSGTSTLVGNDPDRIRAGFEAALANGALTPRRPPLWDGHAAERIVQALVDHS